MSRTIAVDFETYYHKKEFSVSGLGNWRYNRDPQTDAYLVSVFDGEVGWVGHPRDLNWDALKGERLISHNAAFDSEVHAALVEKQLISPLQYEEWQCTANMTSYLFNQRSLNNATRFCYKQSLDKGMRSDMSGKHWADIVAEGPEVEKRLKDYALDDVKWCWKLWQDYNNQWPEWEKRLSLLTINQCSHGVKVDKDKLFRYISVLENTLYNTEERLPWIKTGSAPTSTKAMAIACREAGIPQPPVKSREGEEAFELWAELYGQEHDWIRAVSNHRKISKLLASFNTIKTRLRPDDTIDFSLLYCGTHTGRFAGAGSGLNMQNLRKEPLYISDDYGFFENKLDDPREVVDVRSLFIPREGKQFIISDLSQIEPRCLNWVVGNTSLLDKVRGGMSIYEAHARETMGWTGGPLKSEDKTLYALAKARVLALGYGCGAEKFITMAFMLAGLKITEEVSKETVTAFRNSNPQIVGLWNTLDRALRRSVGSDFEMDLPSGRTMTYRKVRREETTLRDAKTGKITRKVNCRADIGGRRVMTYGGKLTENLIQAIGRDVFGMNLIDLHDAGAPSLFHVHDEAIIETPKGVDPREVEEIMSRTPDWLEGCPIGAEAHVADHYHK